MKMIKFISVFLVAASISVSAFAGEIGKVDVNGKEAILMDDNTWKYSGALADSVVPCSVIKAKEFPISLCLADDNWTKANVNDEAEMQFKLLDDTLFGMVIVDDSQLSNRSFKRQILNNAKVAAGKSPVNIIAESSSVIGGKKLSKIQYQLLLGELDVTYFNYYGGIKGKGAVQLIFFMETAFVSEKLPDIAEVLAKVKFQ